MVANLGEQCVRQRARSQCFSQPASLIISSKLTGRLKMQGQWVRGIIDQLELDDTGQIRVVEHKTRRKPSLPMFAQQQTAKLQVAELLSWLPTEQLVCITMHRLQNLHCTDVYFASLPGCTCTCSARLAKPNVCAYVWHVPLATIRCSLTALM